MLRIVFAFALLLLGAGSASAATEENRVALVIGNAAYKHAHALANPVNDANAMADTLRRLGFEVVAVNDADRTTMVKALGQFRRIMKSDGVGLFYYAGHGMQVRGKNYLLPVDADISDENDAALLAIDLDAVVHEMEDGGVRLSLYILDACRDDPFERRFRSTGSRGLAPVDAARGSVIAFATAPGKTAADGTGDHGLFTGELLKRITKPGLELDDVLKQTAAGVELSSGNQQTPWYNSAFSGHFYFTAPVTVNVTPPVSGAERDLVFWEAIKSSTDPADFEDFVQRFPASEFASLARRRVAALQAPPPTRAPSPSASVAPPAKPSPSPETNWTLDQRRDVQRALRVLGHYQGDADGGFGSGTLAAIRQFQSFAGDPETGDLTAAEHDTLLDMAQRLSALLDQPPTSPQGAAVSSIKGADQRYARAWNFDNGRSVKANPAEAAYWYALAAADGDSRALINLGTLTARGWGASKADPANAALLWWAAAAHGEAIAMYDLGVVYERGIGTAADPVRAKAWYQRAADHNHPEARTALKRLAG